MSGFIVVAFAGLLFQQPLSHPSSQASYTAPAIRPFEPGSDFGREVAEGDAETGPSRAPLTAPVKVEAYVRSYEYTPTDAEAAYEQGVAAAEIRTDQSAGPLDGGWRVSDASGRTLFDLVLTDAGVGAIEGGWRGGSGSGGAVSDGQTLTLEGGGSIALERNRAGWRGQLTRDGRTQTVTFARPD